MHGMRGLQFFARKQTLHQCQVSSPVETHQHTHHLVELYFNELQEAGATICQVGAGQNPPTSQHSKTAMHRKAFVCLHQPMSCPCYPLPPPSSHSR
jgi:hypothetical protein